MNSETALIVAIILGILVLAAAYGALNVGIEGAGESIFGDSESDDGLFNTDPGQENPQFQDSSSDSQENTAFELEQDVEQKVV